jgi:hypothetical protein
MLTRDLSTEPYCKRWLETVVRSLERRAMRLALMPAWMSARGSMAEAIRYALNHREGLLRFLDDGRIELDTNSVERAARPVALGRKNALFAGYDEGAEAWAAITSLIETCKLNGVDPQRYLTDLLTRLVQGWPQSRIDELISDLILRSAFVTQCRASSQLGRVSVRA